jgi:hypothetical protein
VKKFRYRNYRNILSATVLMIFVITACNKYNDLGMELLPSTDLLIVNNSVLKDDISAFTFREDSVSTTNSTNSLLGSINDPVFGNTTINFATQFRIQAFPRYGTNPEVDSTFLYLYYKTIYGDTVTTQRIKVYELNQPIYSDVTDPSGGTSEFTYYQNVDLKSMASTQMIGQLDFIPSIRRDSATNDTLFQVLKIPIDISLAEKLVFADSLNLINNDAFLNYFKGLLIESERLESGKGTILSLEAASSGTFSGSALVVYYNNDENKADTTPDTLNRAYYITEFSTRVNQITHDYSTTVFYNNLNSETHKDSLIFIQTMGGLESKILIENLSTWRDSVVISGNDTIPYGINKAELIFEVDTALSDVLNYPPPKQLLFTYVDTVGQQFIPKDYSFNPAFYGGALGRDYTYRFNITQHLQQIIDGEIENQGFYLTTPVKNSEAKRVVLKGSTSNKGIRLIVTYTKVLH